MKVLAVAVLSMITGCAIVSKLVAWGGGPFGWFVMVANLPYEILMKKAGIRRFAVDSLGLLIMAAGWWFLLDASAALVVITLFATVWSYAQQIEERLMRCAPGEQDRAFQEKDIPFPHPRLIVMVRGPVWRWGRVLDLGDLPVGWKSRCELLVLNPTSVRAQVPCRLLAESSGEAFQIAGLPDSSFSAPGPGELLRFPFTVDGVSEAPRVGGATVILEMGTFRVRKRFRVRSVFPARAAAISSVRINRWRGGTVAGFAWRGDMDLYDPATLQSVEGLRVALGLSSRFCMASTLFLSGRLTLDEEEHAKFCEKLGVDRQTSGIGGFIRFVKEEVSLGHGLDFPVAAKREFAMEIGNHMYLHYGTHAAMAEGNGWRVGASILDGSYPWQRGERSSFSEQRDNAIKNREEIERVFGFRVKTWGVPGRNYDSDTARAVEAAGSEVGSDTNASALTNVLRLPLPHHPEGCEHLVELTKKYPGDPDNIFKLAALKYWLWLAEKRRGVLVFMAHHHLLGYEGKSGASVAEEMLRYTYESGGGRFFISTLYGLGRYWERVLCATHRVVRAEFIGNATVRVWNAAEDGENGVPIEVEWHQGQRMVTIVDVPGKESVDVRFV